ncbi:MAG: 3'-5' exonuclease, partial [Alphaproteobacteria bacterium]
TPYQLYSTLLTTGGRERILARFGYEASEVLDEFLLLALAYGERNTASLQTFLHSLQSVPPKLQRQAIADNTVRVMTVHGSKGLEARAVIIVDSPDVNTSTTNPFLFYGEKDLLLRPRVEEDCARTKALKEQQEKREWEEENRLLYVAMTRAKDSLYITGWEHQRGVATWYHDLVAVLNPTIDDKDIDFLDCTAKLAIDDEGQTLRSLPLGLTRGSLRTLLCNPESLFNDAQPTISHINLNKSLESERGVRIHRLLEVLPTLPLHLHSQSAQRILGDLPDAMVIFEQVQAILTHPEWAPFFGPGSLAEVPIVVQINGQAQSLRIDRLLIQPQRIAILDYKTHAEPPLTAAAISSATREQLAIYAQAVQKLYPQLEVDIYILWTATLTLMPVPLVIAES